VHLAVLPFGVTVMTALTSLRGTLAREKSIDARYANTRTLAGVLTVDVSVGVDYGAVIHKNRSEVLVEENCNHLVAGVGV
jgi:hypothetical protein